MLLFLKNTIKKFLQSGEAVTVSYSSVSDAAFSEWFHSQEKSFGVYGKVSPPSLSRLQADVPSEWKRTIEAADKILRHEFNLLGSGVFVPVDPERSPTATGYKPIDWYLDPVSILRFPQRVPYKEWKLYEMRPGLADIKLPWELARCQHWVTLAQAFLQTGDARYGQEIADELADFQEANPVGFGINWTCTMDVAIRAANWVIAFTIMKDWQREDLSFWRRAYQSLFEHGVFIYQNLENHYEVTSNHFLSNVVGLYMLSSCFLDLPEGKEWDKFCRKAIEEEITKQILDDGADFESSIPYHRLVLELFLGAARIAQLRDEPFSPNFHVRLRSMVEFLIGVIRPDGSMPQSGDADDGRLHIFTGYGEWNPQDPRHVFAPAAMILNEQSWLHYVGEEGIWEAAWWGFDLFALDLKKNDFPCHGHLYPEAGFAVYRDRGTYLLIANGKVGTEGFGNHKHNDLLSFEYHVEARPIFVDPGSFVYTSDPVARNQFRSTRYHNTLMIDGEEQNEVNPEWLFRLIERAYPTHVKFCETAECVEYIGHHKGYEGLPESLNHERLFRLWKTTNILMIQDQLSGSGNHALQWNFHLDPEVKIEEVEENLYLLQSSNVAMWFGWYGGKSEPTSHIVESWYSPSYGVKKPCKAIEMNLLIDVGQCQQFSFFCIPSQFLPAKLEKNGFFEFCQNTILEGQIPSCPTNR